MSEGAAGTPTRRTLDTSYVRPLDGASTPADDIVYGLTCFAGWAFSKLYFRLSASGWRHVPRRGPVLLVANHLSVLDPPLVGFCLPRHMTYFAKAELFGNRLFGRYLRMLSAFPVHRGAGDRGALQACFAALEAGRALVMFPEGTRSLDGKPREPQPGVAMIVARYPTVPVVPVRIEGSFEALPPRTSVPRPRKIHVRYGPPFVLSDLEPLPEQKKQLYRELGRKIMDRISQA